MDLLQKLIFIQNEELLKRIANDRYKIQGDKDDFIQKYLKKGYTHLNIVKKDQVKVYERKYERVMR